MVLKGFSGRARLLSPENYSRLWVVVRSSRVSGMDTSHSQNKGQSVEVVSRNGFSGEVFHAKKAFIMHLAMKGNCIFIKK